MNVPILYQNWKIYINAFVNTNQCFDLKKCFYVNYNFSKELKQLAVATNWNYPFRLEDEGGIRTFKKTSFLVM
jgi:hypothetical protein